MKLRANDIVMVTEKNDVGRVWFGLINQIIDDEIIVCAFRAKYGADVHRENSVLFHFSLKYNDFVVLANYESFGG